MSTERLPTVALIAVATGALTVPVMSGNMPKKFVKAVEKSAANVTKARDDARRSASEFEKLANQATLSPRAVRDAQDAAKKALEAADSALILLPKAYRTAVQNEAVLRHPHPRIDTEELFAIAREEFLDFVRFSLDVVAALKVLRMMGGSVDKDLAKRLEALERSWERMAKDLMKSTSGMINELGRWNLDLSKWD